MLETRSAVYKMIKKEVHEDRKIKNWPPAFSSDITPYTERDFSVQVRRFCATKSVAPRISKMIVLGDVAVGKTSLVNRFCHKSFNKNYKATIGVDFEVEKFDILGVPFHMQIWDTAGQERFKCIAASYYRGANVIMIVFDLGNLMSLSHCQQWLQEASRSNTNPHHIFLVGTKRDLLSNQVYQVIEKRAVGVATIMKAEFWAVSSRTGDGVPELFSRIAVLSFNSSILREMQSYTIEPKKVGSTGLMDALQPKAVRMAGSPVLEDTDNTEILDESFLSTLDIALLAVLILTGLWWLMKRNKQDEYAPSTKSYSIQPTSYTAVIPSENSFIKKLQTSGRSLVVFYGSQTGTGEEFAGRLAKEGIRYRMKGMVADPEECDMEELVNLKTIPNSMAVFCMATYGEGDPTDNAMEFVDWLKTGEADLTGLNYAVFGLGNKTYEHYNEVAIYIDHRLEQLGATRVYELGLGDDDANIEDDFITWKDKFWPAVCDFFGIEGISEDVSIRQYKLTEHLDLPADRIYHGEIARLHSFKNQRPPYDAKNPYLAPVKENRELHGPKSERSCMHIEFDIEGSKMRYDTGDHLAVYPVNSSELVDKIGVKCGVDLDTVFTLTNTDEESTKKHPFPCPCSYRTALTHYLDITGHPRTHILKELAEYCSDPADKEKLKLMASTTTEGKALYNQWMIQENRNIVQILEDIPSLKPAIDHLCELLPRLQCRYYSISSSPKLHPTTVHITAVVVEYKTPTGRINRGVTTSWLKEKHPSDPPCLVPIFVRKSQFRLPLRTSTPIIMVGPGTGLAPFRGFIQERDLARKEGKEVGDTILYFGCRKSEEDFLYKEELEEYVKSGTLTLHCAFSREQANKVYVTHLLEKNKDELWDVIGEKNGHIYVCGDARNMARDVHNILLKVVMQNGKMTEMEAQDYIKKMDTQKRYSSDVWS
ncbi:NADPH--cytochrome P450 reductase isoform X5 [Belonocnema kinseyi]|uniref:NADPH--cytochrome P450 reductase isoform X5 n=2 Tax=Belonocnema kinseyi TaxID=2817044 RepID=UPI00143D5247|nr:NADPH--cytochrome P450 reductase isoform X5 [Belonocnema kinseyi]